MKKELLHMPSLSINLCKGKEKVNEFEDGLGSKPLEVEEASMQFDVIESYSQMEVLRIPYSILRNITFT